MLRRVLKSGEGFVIVLIKEGSEANGPCEFYNIGTIVEVIDFRHQDNGLLGITVRGVSKVLILDARQQEDGLYIGDVLGLGEEVAMPLQEQDRDLASLLEALVTHPALEGLQLEAKPGCARDLGWRLIELLPIGLADKQYLLALEDPAYRLEQIRYLLHAME